MPNVRNYRTGSIVYFQMDKGENIYVLQSGKIALISTASGTTTEEREELKVGEFFGIKSALGNFPREETAQAITNSSLVVFNQQEFEKYIANNSRLIIQTLKLFSNELRNVHIRLRSIFKKGKETSNAYELLNTAESFHKEHSLNHAIYAYKYYLSNYPDGKNKDRVNKLLELCKKDNSFPEGFPHPKPEADMEEKTMKSENNIESTLTREGIADKNSPLNALYKKASEALSENELHSAITYFEELLKVHFPKTNIEKKLYAQSQFEFGIALLKSKRYTEAKQAFSKYVRTYTTGKYTKNCVYQLAKIHELEGDNERARILYHKVATLPPSDDSVTAKARNKLQGGV